MRSTLLALFAAGLAGCAPSSVGSIDLLDPRVPPTRGTLLVVPVTSDQMTRPRPNPAPTDLTRTRDTVRVAGWVPRDSLGGLGYGEFAVEAIAGAVREAGRWQEVRTGPAPSGVAFSEQTYTVRGYSKTRSRPTERRTGVTAPPAGAVGLFGDDVDVVAFLLDPAVGFSEAQQRAAVGVLGGLGVVRDSNDDVAIGATVVLWDNRAGRVLTYGAVEGGAPIRSRLTSSERDRWASTLLEGARNDLRQRLPDEAPFLLGGE